MTHEPQVSPGLREKLLAYEQLRQEGMLPVDAGREMGVGYDRGRQYERWYRKRAALPERIPGQRRYQEDHELARGLTF